MPPGVEPDEQRGQRRALGVHRPHRVVEAFRPCRKYRAATPAPSRTSTRSARRIVRVLPFSTVRV
jgi:hypothetical protein